MSELVSPAWGPAEWAIFASVIVVTLAGTAPLYLSLPKYLPLGSGLGGVLSVAGFCVAFAGGSIAGAISTREFCETLPAYCSQHHVATLAANSEAPATPAVHERVIERVIERVVTEPAVPDRQPAVRGFTQRIMVPAAPSADQKPSRPFATAALRLPDPTRAPTAPPVRQPPAEPRTSRPQPDTKPKPPTQDPIASQMIQELVRHKCLAAAEGRVWGDEQVTAAVVKFSVYGYATLPASPKPQSLDIMRNTPAPACK
ncbi:MAG: hypothetical protein AAFY64_08660 [Pseudomonadota bacterium]